MIVGELIGIVIMFVVWSLFIIGIIGIKFEFRDDWKHMNDGWTMAFIIFIVFGGVVGCVMLSWFFSFTGIDQIWYDMFIGFWNLVI